MQGGSPEDTAAVRTQPREASSESKPHVFSGHSGDVWRDVFQPGSNPRSRDAKENIDTAAKGSWTPLDVFMRKPGGTK